MAADAVHAGGRRFGLIAVWLGALLVALIGVLSPSTASAHIGESYLQVPGVKGGAQVAPYKKWVKAEAQYWQQADFSLINPKNLKRFRRGRLFYSGPEAPHEGASTLALAIDKRDPALPKLMKQCANKVHFPELNYAESSQR